MWLDRVKRVYGDDLKITWKHFSLEQNEHEEDDDSKVWEEPNDSRAKYLLAMRAAEAARRQGEDAFERFHLALLTARHEGSRRIPLNDPDPLVKVAQEVGLDVERFKKDLNDRELLENIGRDHTEAVEKHGVFGTPTFVFENSTAAFLKTYIPPEDDSAAFFEHFIELFGRRPFVGEIKRPQPPWPKGALK